MFHNLPCRVFVGSNLGGIELHIFAVEGFERALFEWANDIERKAMFGEVGAKHCVATKQRAGNVVLWFANGGRDYFTHTVRGCHRRFECAKIHTNINSAMIHD
jgi:hypothetical protein